MVSKCFYLSNTATKLVIQAHTHILNTRMFIFSDNNRGSSNLFIELQYTVYPLFPISLMLPFYIMGMWRPLSPWPSQGRRLPILLPLQAQGCWPPKIPSSARDKTGRNHLKKKITHPPPSWDRRTIQPNHIKFRTCSALSPMWIPPTNESAEINHGAL
jgi:hypothetical protein